MALETTVELVLYLAVTIFFSAISIQRETPLGYMITGISWLLSGMLTFLYDPASFFSWAISLFFVLLGMMFLYLSVTAIFQIQAETKASTKQRFTI